MAETFFIRDNNKDLEMYSHYPYRAYELLEFISLLENTEGKEIIAIGVDRENHTISFYTEDN